MSTTKSPEALISEDSLLSLADYLDLLNEVSTEPRFRILFYLERVDEDNASSIADELGMDPGTLRHHLKRLTEDGLIRNWQRTSRDDDGNYSYYTSTGLGERITNRVADLIEADQKAIPSDSTMEEPADFADGSREDAEDDQSDSPTTESVSTDRRDSQSRRRQYYAVRAPVKSTSKHSVSPSPQGTPSRGETAPTMAADATSETRHVDADRGDDSEQSLLDSAVTAVTDHLPGGIGDRTKRRRSPESPASVRTPQREDLSGGITFDDYDTAVATSAADRQLEIEYSSGLQRGPHRSFSRTKEGLKSRKEVEYAMKEEFQTRHHGRVVNDFSPPTGGDDGE